jgi:aryl carrier-like protein
LHLESFTAVEATNYPLNLIIHGGLRHGEPLAVRLGYDPDLFDAATVEGLGVELVGLLEDLTAGSALPAVPEPPSTIHNGFTSEERAYLAPRTATEQALADIWADVLTVDRVGVHDNFFTLGGDSILCMRVAARLRADLGVTLSPRALFDNPTVGALALLVAPKNMLDYEL